MIKGIGLIEKMNTPRNYDIIPLMKRNFCTFYEYDRSHHECFKCVALKSCTIMEKSINSILNKKEKHDNKFFNALRKKFKI